MSFCARLCRSSAKTRLSALPPLPTMRRSRCSQVCLAVQLADVGLERLERWGKGAEAQRGTLAHQTGARKEGAPRARHSQGDAPLGPPLSASQRLSAPASQPRLSTPAFPYRQLDPSSGKALVRKYLELVFPNKSEEYIPGALAAQRGAAAEKQEGRGSLPLFAPFSQTRTLRRGTPRTGTWMPKPSARTSTSTTCERSSTYERSGRAPGGSRPAPCPDGAPSMYLFYSRR